MRHVSHKDCRTLRNPAVITIRYISFGLMGLSSIVCLMKQAAQKTKSPELKCYIVHLHLHSAGKQVNTIERRSTE